MLFSGNARSKLYVSVTALRALRSKDLTSAEKLVRTSTDRKERVELLGSMEGIGLCGREGGLGLALRSESIFNRVIDGVLLL